ncbi:hypothetical protein DTO021C3_6678 [Paecilomyces variotii]|nr:hypothetical protein DTO021C3_6678 [Paecilomyces variotii]
MSILTGSSLRGCNAFVVVLCLTYILPAVALVPRNPYSKLVARQTPDPLEVDVGYATYRGYHNDTTGLNTWLGIRFAEPPVGSLRWQKPVPPRTPQNKTEVVNADKFPNQCPQAPQAAPSDGPFQSSTSQSEDCLFLNVYAPSNATGLPVFVYIHGGGYGSGNGQSNIPVLLNGSGEDFVGVAIQYRLGAFGFLSSDEVKRFGTANAGLLDQYLALQWVQRYIGLFGGDPLQVTIAGESAGAGSVMLQAMAYGGSIGTSLFQNIIAASPYLPMQYRYSDFVPSQMYYTFAAAAGCFDGLQTWKEKISVFDCLVNKDTETLQNASYTVTVGGKYGQWAFLPVTDNDFVQQVPSQQLLNKQVNGERLLISNNADEGTRFTPQKIDTEEDFVNFIKSLFPLFTESDVNKTLLYYPSTTAPVDKNDPKFATSGTGTPTALNESSFGTGQQQRADNLYAEVTFDCPAYWLAEAFGEDGRKSYKYQYSIIPAIHAYDMDAYFGPRPDTMSVAFQEAVKSIWNSFIVTGDPTEKINNTIPANTTNVIKSWTPFTVGQPFQLNLNQTGGHPTTEEDSVTDIDITVYEGSGLRPDFDLVNAYTWEGGRGQRCDFWRSVSGHIPG